MVNKNYPHPVLTPYSDDFDPSKATFDIKISRKIERNNYQLYCEVDLNEKVLQELLRDGKIAFVVKILCSTTRYREVFQFNSLEHLITIPSSLLEKRAEISTFIIASEQINNYSSPLFNEIYEDANFVIFPGDVLAEGSEYKFNIEKQIDPLAKVPSIFTIVYSDNNHAPPADFSYNEEKIVVTLNKMNFQKYKDLKEMQNHYAHLSPLTSSLFILPVLVIVVQNIREELSDIQGDIESIKDYIEDKESGYKWFKVINTRLVDQGIKLTEPDNITDSSLVIAQKLLGDPLSNGLEFFEELLSNNEEDSV
jgi:hypothetical protein